MTSSRIKSTGLGVAIILVNVLLVALVAIGISQRGFSGWWDTLRGEWVPLNDAVAITDPWAPDDLEQTSAAPDPQLETATPTETAEPTTEEPEPVTAMDRYADEEDLTVVVLGDQTGIDTDDWVGAWSQVVARERSVEVHYPRADDPTQFAEPLELGDGEAMVTIYNASHADGTPEYAAERLPLFAPEQPDVVLLNYGRSNTADDIASQLSDLADALEDEFPDAELHAIVQPPRQDGGSVTSGAVRDWAKQTSTDLIDVAKVFYDEGIIESTVSQFNPLSVDAVGDQRWAEVVHERVFGDLPEAPEPAPIEQAPVAPVDPSPVEPAPVEPAPVEPAPVEPPPYVPPQPTQPPYVPPPYTPPPWTPPPPEEPTDPPSDPPTEEPTDPPSDPPTEEPTGPETTEPVDPGDSVEPTP